MDITRTWLSRIFLTFCLSPLAFVWIVAEKLDGTLEKAIAIVAFGYSFMYLVAASYLAFRVKAYRAVFALSALVGGLPFLVLTWIWMVFRDL